MMQKTNYVRDFKSYLILSVLMGYFILLIFRLYEIQIIDHDEYIAMANAQYSGRSLDMSRGKIYFSEKGLKGELAADTKEVEKTTDNKTVIIKERIYPYGDVAAKVLGFVAYDENDRIGRYGIERYYNDVLTRDNEKMWTNFFAEVFADTEGSLTKTDPLNEGDIILTIEGEEQKYLHEILKKTKETWKSDKIGGIIMSTRDGRIYAMEELDSFDPNNFGKVDNIQVYVNNMVSGVYEMGSIIKPLTVAAALDNGNITLDSFYDDVGQRTLNGKKVSNYDGVARGWVSVQEILSQSLNIGIVHLVEKLGDETFQKYFKSYGLGEETGIDLPSESSGLTRNLDSDILVDNATAGFGQGIAITPIQTVRALASLGNGGRLVNPYIVDSIEFKDGKIKKIIPDDPIKIFKNEHTSENISRMLVKVVDTALLKGKQKRENYSIAAKTGTAQMVDPSGRYSESEYLHSIFGYFPVYDPQYIVFLYQINPKHVDYASKTLTEPLFDVIDFLISYNGVVPDR